MKNITRLSTNSSQQVTSTNQPDAFGLGSVTSGTASSYAYGASSGYREDGISPAGLPSYYAYQKVGARYYDPTFAVFLTRDTDLSQSAYAYCDGDPVNFSDPSGHKKKKGPPTGMADGGAAGGSIGGALGGGSGGSGGGSGGSGGGSGGSGGSAGAGAASGGNGSASPAGLSDEQKAGATVVGGLAGLSVGILTKNRAAGVIAGGLAQYGTWKLAENWPSIWGSISESLGDSATSPYTN